MYAVPHTRAACSPRSGIGTDDHFLQLKEAVDRAVPFTKKMSIADPILKDSPVKAQKDALDLGVYNSQGNQLPPSYNMQVNNCIFADVEEYIKKTATMNIIGLEDLSGATHPFQEHPLLFKKWDPVYGELCLLVGNDANTRQMVVLISKDRRLKVICFLEEDDSIVSGHSKTIRQICTVLRILNSDGEHFPWARAQLFVLENLLCIAIRTRYIQAKGSKKCQEDISTKKQRLPPSMYYRMTSIEAVVEAQFAYADDLEITIPKQATAFVCTIYKYLVRNQPWKCPFGHIIPRILTWTSYSDASEQCIGLFIKSEKVFCILLFTQSLKARIDANEAHINNLEYIALYLARFLVQLLYSQNPGIDPPHPCHDAKGDNKPSIGWLNNPSTASKLG